MPAIKITRVKDGSGDVHFRFTLEDGTTEPDVVFTKITKETVDASDFGIAALPTEVTVYHVESHGSHAWQIMWNETKKQLLLRTPEKEIKNYSGGSLDDCILLAYNDGALA